MSAYRTKQDLPGRRRQGWVTAGLLVPAYGWLTLAVFLPTTPNPTSGFLLYVPKSQIIELAMSVEDGAKLIISAGLISPEYHATTAALAEAALGEKARPKRSGNGEASPDQ